MSLDFESVSESHPLIDRRAMRSLLVDEYPLSGEPPAITTQFACPANDSMAGDHERDSVRSAGPRDRPRGVGVTYSGCYFCIGLNFTVRNGLEVIPHSNLEGRGSNVEGQIQMRVRPCQMVIQGFRPLLKVGMIRLAHGHETRRGILLFEHRQQASARISELQETESSIGCADHDQSQRGFDCNVRDGHIPPPSPILIRCHAQARIGSFVNAAGGTIPGFVNCFRHVSRLFFQTFLQVSQARRIQVLLRTQPQNVFERPLKVRRAHPRLLCEVFEFQGLVTAFLDITTQLPHQLGCWVGADSIQGAAPQARAEVISFRFSRRLVKSHIFEKRSTGWAGRAAVYAGGENAVEKSTVSAFVSRLNCFPAFILIQHEYLHDFPVAG